MTRRRPSDSITLTGLRVRANHGVYDFERRDGQDFVVDVTVWASLGEAAGGDDLAQTIHYGELAEAVAAAVGSDPVDLIETLAERVARVALTPRPAQRTRVTVHKPQAPIGVEFADVAVAIERDRAWLWKPVVIALGSNLGARHELLSAAVAELDAADGVYVEAVSPVVETVALTDAGRDRSAPGYLNAVVLARTTMTPHELLALAHEIEDAHGRERSVHWGDRTLDIDLIDYAGQTIDEPELRLPHPRAAERDFVLAPWNAVDPEAVLPGFGPVAELLAGLEAT